MSQIGLPFDWAGTGEGDSFIVSEANALAVRHVERWRDWPIPVAVLSGPPRSGRSTLARHFTTLSGGIVIEDAQAQPNEALFHAWNIAVDTRRPLLLVGSSAPAGWTVALPDLRSRLAAVPHVAIAEPDEALARALIEKGLSRAGTGYSPDAIEWLVRRIDRSYAEVARTLALLNQASLSSSRKISVPFAKEALQNAGYLPIVAPDQMAQAPLAQREKEE